MIIDAALIYYVSYTEAFVHICSRILLLFFIIYYYYIFIIIIIYFLQNF
jgi:hypothetical protein